MLGFDQLWAGFGCVAVAKRATPPAISPCGLGGLCFLLRLRYTPPSLYLPSFPPVGQILYSSSSSSSSPSFSALSHSLLVCVHSISSGHHHQHRFHFFLFYTVSSCQRKAHNRSNSPFPFCFLVGVDGLGLQC